MQFFKLLKCSIWLGPHFPPCSEYSSTDSFITLLKSLYLLQWTCSITQTPWGVGKTHISWAWFISLSHCNPKLRDTLCNQQSITQQTVWEDVFIILASYTHSPGLEYILHDRSHSFNDLQDSVFLFPPGNNDIHLNHRSCSLDLFKDPILWLLIHVGYLWDHLHLRIWQMLLSKATCVAFKIYILSVHIPGNQTHDLVTASAMQ